MKITFEPDEARFELEEDSVCYGCKYYTGTDDGGDTGCEVQQLCCEGSMNGYRMED